MAVSPEPRLKAKTTTLQGPQILEILDDRIELRRSCFYYEESRRLRLDDIAALCVSRRIGSSSAVATAAIGLLSFLFIAVLAEEPAVAPFRWGLAIVGAALLVAALILTIRGVDLIDLVASDGYRLRFPAGGSRARRERIVEEIARAIRARRASPGGPT